MESENESENDGTLGSVKTISTTCLLLSGVAAFYFQMYFGGGMVELFKGMNLVLPMITKLTIMGFPKVGVVVLTLAGLVFAFVLEPVKAVKGQALMMIGNIGFSLLTSLAIIAPLMSLIEALQ